jgi:hypothetical protein
MKTNIKIHLFLDSETEENVRDESIEIAKDRLAKLLNKKQEDIDFNNFEFHTELICKVSIKNKLIL